MCCILIHVIKIFKITTLYPEGHEIYNFGKPFLGHQWYMYIFSLCALLPGV